MTRRYLASRWMILIGTAVAAAAGASPSASPQLATAQTRKAAPAFSLTDANGMRVRLSDYRNRVVVLDFWATWCTGCKVEIPWFEAFQRQYAKQGLSTIGVAMDQEGWSLVKPFLAEHPIQYPIVLGVEGPGEEYGIVNLPVTLLIDRHGNIVESHTGVVDKDQWETKVRGLLAER